MHKELFDQQDPETIQKLFNSIAGSYDLGNAILSFQMHKWWNAQLVKRTVPQNRNTILLDLCCGTGDITFTHLKKSSHKTTAFLLDFSEEMLRCARKKAKQFELSRHDLRYIQGDAMAIPLPEKSVDAVTIAYGIRNVQDSLQCIREIHRVLNPSGSVGILELTRPANPLLRFFHRCYLKCFLPLCGKLMASNSEAYSYLSRSIYQFSSPETLKSQLLRSGFVDIRTTPLSGGIATILVATKA